MRADVIVLGAGIVGVCVALHLQKAGHFVVLVDRRKPGEETSFGNAGLIQKEGVFPYGFPHDFGALWRYALNRTVDAHYHPLALPKIAPFLLRYWLHSRPKRHAAIAQSYAPLIMASVDEHLKLADEAGARHLIRERGWLKLFRTHKEIDIRVREAENWEADFGVKFAALTASELGEKEPFLSSNLSGALHWLEPASVTDPHGLTMAYVALFERLGGVFIEADARSLEPHSAGWSLVAQKGVITAPQAVLALGPWSELVSKKLGYSIPFAVKRGYHMHYQAAPNAVLNHTVLDAERGYLLAPMAKGIRLTTGAEFAMRDAPKTPVQLARAEPIAKSLFPLGERLDSEPWMGSRPCTPDMMPIIGPAPRHKGLWFSFGHAHHGLTLGSVTGRLIAEMISHKTPFTDPAPYRVDRF
jgi:D-amino-acid dehydrogenase